MTVFFMMEKNQAKEAWEGIKLLQSCCPSKESNKAS
jgi:hypothetical protein